jgi:hypothetical protein
MQRKVTDSKCWTPAGFLSPKLLPVFILTSEKIVLNLIGLILSKDTKEKFKFQTLFSHETLEKLFYFSAIKGLSLDLFKFDPNKTK